MKYFAVIDKQQIGPCSIEELVQAGLRPDTYVWCKGMEDWTPAKDVADICRHFRRRLFDKMHPTAPQAPSPTEPGAPASDYELHQMSRREFWQEVSREVAESQPSEEELTALPPSTWWPFPILLSLLFFFPLGIPAVICSRKAGKLWNEGRHAESHEAARIAKIYGGVAIAMGLLLTAFLF